MKILMLGHQNRNYGTYWRLFFLARGLQKLGHDVTVATVSLSSRWKAEVETVDGVTIWQGPNLLHDLPGQGTGPLDILGRIELIKYHHYDVVHGFEFQPNVRWPMYQAMKNKKTLVLSDWCDWYSEAGLGPTWGKVPGVKHCIRWQEDRIREKVHGVTVISHLLEKRVQQLINNQNKILYLPGGAPVDVIKKEDKQKCRSQWEIAQDKKVVAFVGSNQGDLDLLVKAFILVAAKQPQSLLMIIGPANKEAMALLRSAQLQNRVVVTGKFKYEDLSSLMGCADVFALPLRDTIGNRARWPNKLGEYLSAGRPVVASDAGEPGYFFHDHDIGQTVENSEQAFATAINYYFDHPLQLASLGEKCRQVAEQVLAWDKLSVELYQFYKKMLNMI